VESLGGVRKLTPNTLFSSGAITESTSAPDLSCLYMVARTPYSSTFTGGVDKEGRSEGEVGRRLC